MAKINHKDLLEYFIHEVTQINSVIKASSELLSKRSTELKDKKTIAYHANLVHENSAILNYLVDVVNYKLNPAFFLNQDKDLRNVHGKYSKIIQSFERRKKDKRIKIILCCDVKSLVNLYPIFETIPYITLDNAIKYSPKDSEILVEIGDYSTFIRITVQNNGPYITDFEKEHIFDYGFRGEEAKKMSSIGQGFGLNFLKEIIEIHNGSVKIESGEVICVVNDIAISEFKLIMELPK